MRRDDVLHDWQQIGDALDSNLAPTRITALLDFRAGQRIQIAGPIVHRDVKALLVMTITEMQGNPIVGSENPLAPTGLNETATRGQRIREVDNRASDVLQVAHAPNLFVDFLSVRPTVFLCRLHGVCRDA